MRKLLTAILFLMSSVMCFAEDSNWVRVDCTEEISVHKKIIATSGRTYRVWIRREYYNMGLKYICQLWEVSPDFSQYKIIDYVAYDKDLNVERVDFKPTDYFYIVSDSVGATIVNTVIDILDELT